MSKLSSPNPKSKSPVIPKRGRYCHMSKGTPQISKATSQDCSATQLGFMAVTMEIVMPALSTRTLYLLILEEAPSIKAPNLKKVL